MTAPESIALSLPFLSRPQLSIVEPLLETVCLGEGDDLYTLALPLTVYI